MNIDIARQKMIKQQVRAWDVFDPDVLEVLSNVPREQFVPFGYETLAFADTEIPIGQGQSMMTPTVEGRVLQALEVDGRLFVVIGDAPVMDALIVRKTGENAWASETLFETELTPLVNGALPPQFFF